MYGQWAYGYWPYGEGGFGVIVVSNLGYDYDYSTRYK
jgi:hypothetical protein